MRKTAFKEILRRRSTLRSFNEMDMTLEVLYKLYESSDIEKIENDKAIELSIYNTKRLNTIRIEDRNSNLICVNENLNGIKEIAVQTNASYDELCKKMIPLIIRQKVFDMMPYLDGFSCNKDGDIKTIIYADFKDEVNDIINVYHYTFESEEPYKEKNDRKTTILKYKLNLY